MDFFGLDSIRSEDILEIVDGYQGLGYGLSCKEELGRLLYFFKD